MKNFLIENKYEYYENYKLSKITTIKNSGTCKYFVIINNYNELYFLIDYLKEKKRKYLIIGNGSKLVFVKNYNGVIISLKKLNRIKIDKLVEVESGALIANLIHKLANYNLGGIEALIGVPASVGGALINNVSAHNCILSDYLEKIILYQDNQIILLTKKDLNFDYRSSNLKNTLILKCYFKFKNIEKSIILDNIKKYLNYRINVQEVNYPNIGSIFKNDEKSAVEIIKECQLEKFKYKNISLSQKHLNFIKVNGKVKGKNIYKFVKKIQRIVYLKKKIKLKSEIIFIK